MVREATVYDLVGAKNGTKTKPSAADGGSPGSNLLHPAAKPMMNAMRPNGCEMTATSGPMPTIASMLAGQMAASVTDKTGLSGVYDFTLQWSSENLSATPGTDADESRFPSLSTAVKEQLGLELKPAKGTIDTIVIDCDSAQGFGIDGRPGPRRRTLGRAFAQRIRTTMKTFAAPCQRRSKVRKGATGRR